MRTPISALALILSLGILPAAHAAGDQERRVRFSPLPMQSRDSMTRRYQAFMDYLEKGLRQPFEMLYHQSYETLLNEFSQGRIDLAYLGPLPYVVLKARMPSATPVVRFLEPDGSASYSCSIIRFVDHPLDLRSRAKTSVALTQPLSTCGYLGVELLLQRQGASLESPRFDHAYVGNHDEVALEVLLGKADMGGVKTSIGETYRPLGVVSMAETGPMPGFLLVANSDTLSEEEIERIRVLLMRLDPLNDERDRALTRAWGPNIRHGVIPVEDEDYNGVRQAWARLENQPKLAP